MCKKKPELITKLIFIINIVKGQINLVQEHTFKLSLKNKTKYATHLLPKTGV